MRYGKLANKIVSLLASGLVLGYTKDRKQRNELLKECDRIWLSIDRNQLFQILYVLKFGKFLEVKKKEGRKYINLTSKGMARANKLLLQELEIKKPKRWDKKWRIVIFDIPEKQKKLRDELRRRLKLLGFAEFQKSVFVFHYPCEDEINILVNFFGLHEHVRYLESILSYDSDLRKIFNV